MAIPAKTILITTLAEYQTRFWIPVAQRLRATGCEVELLAFDDRSAEMSEAAGIPVTNMYREGLKTGPSPEEPQAFDTRIEAYGLDGSNFLFSHERFTFGIRDTAALRRRFMIYANAMEALLDRFDAQGKPAVLVQELGGFLSVIASFYAAKRRGVRSWFIEPSFFRGRMYFTPDNLAAPQVMAKPADAVSPEVRAYLDDTLKQQAIVIPKKDQHHYSAAFKKVINLRNSRRLAEKLWDQFALGKHQEFGHNLRHARVHAAMAVNATRLKTLYRPIPDTRFVYYPFHVPADMALTLRSPDYLDQVATVDFLLRTIPDSHVLVVKEHPAQIGAISADRLLELARRFDNFVLLPPQTNNYTVLNRADAIISVNSKSGAEALLLGKPVVVMGDAFYSSCPLITTADRLRDVPARLREALRAGPFEPAKATPYFEAAWRRSFPGELYISDPRQLDTFAASLRAAVVETVNAD
ncbi:capsule biosynthesis protein [Bradyrhizobium sp. LTSP857]|uniref:capsular polysaccharide export protein, LipB/KpsS family n=1 Tax=Bradyrhizobium sp. LTSP857 TaxID=1619231 RepID=UPI0005D20512|nr:capsule biosynthesis protein [Bradyrhizobium sp. LTSP857]KJC50773.1 capsule biosynthesis protein [Bradyrhizobium sp. LTSP857]